MSESVSRVRDLAKQLGVSIPEDRLQAVADNYEASLQEADTVRPEENPMPEPAAFDASWEATR